MGKQYAFMTDDQKDLVALAHQIAESELTPELIRECDLKDEFPRHVLDVFREQGFYGMDIPEKYGGPGFDRTTRLLIFEEMAKFDAGFSFNFEAASSTFGILMVANASEEIKQYYADRVLKDGFMGCFGLTEPEAGSDATAIKTTAVKDGNEWVLNGRKCFITNAPLADMFIIAAYTDKNKGAHGISLFLCEREKHGVKTSKPEDKMGLRLSVTGDVILEDVRIPEQNLIGQEGMGFIYAMKMIEAGRATTMVHALGIAQAALEYAAKYAQQRKTFGKPIIEHDGVAYLLADMQTRVDAMRAIIYYAARMADEGMPLGTLSPSTKLFVSENLMQVTSDAVQVLGGYGYMRDYPVEKLLRDSKIFSLFEGTNQINRQVSGALVRRDYRIK